jgi:hypothetical protein
LENVSSEKIDEIKGATIFPKPSKASFIPERKIYPTALKNFLIPSKTFRAPDPAALNLSEKASCSLSIIYFS